MTGSRRRRRGGTCHSVVGEGGQRWESQEEKKEGSRKTSEIGGMKETDETSPPSIDEQPNDPHTHTTHDLRHRDASTSQPIRTFPLTLPAFILSGSCPESVPPDTEVR